MATEDKVKARTASEQRAGRRALKLHAAEARQREIEADMRKQCELQRADPIPMAQNREPTEPACWVPPPAGYIYLPDQIRSCIERADRAYNLAYRPGWRTRLARWVVSKVAQLLRVA